MPRSAAVIGVSEKALNVGRVILRNLLAGGGIPKENLSVIHPKAAEIDGCRAFPSTAAMPAPVDMAVVAVPADGGADKVVLDLVESRRARTITLIAGGFGETEAGKSVETHMREVIEASHRAPDGGVLVNGGNCLGIISVPGGTARSSSRPTSCRSTMRRARTSRASASRAPTSSRRSRTSTAPCAPATRSRSATRST